MAAMFAVRFIGRVLANPTSIFNVRRDIVDFT